MSDVAYEPLNPHWNCQREIQKLKAEIERLTARIVTCPKGHEHLKGDGCCPWCDREMLKRHIEQLRARVAEVEE